MNEKSNIIMELLHEADESRVTIEKDGYVVGFRYILDINEAGVASFGITKEQLSVAGLSKYELFEIAKKNTPRILPLRKMPLHSALGLVFGNGIENYVLTNDFAFHGAATIFYDGVLDAVLDEWGCGFFILPSSIHEVIVIPDDGQMDVSDLNAMVREVNAVALMPEDVLGDTVMYYDERGLRVA